MKTETYKNINGSIREMLLLNPFSKSIMEGELFFPCKKAYFYIVKHIILIEINRWTVI